MRNTAIRTLQPLALALILAGTSTVALANPPYWHDQHRDDRARKDDRSRRDDHYQDRRAVRDMVGEIEHNYRGHVVDVQPPATNEEMYRVRVLQEGGRVKTLRVPAKRDRDHR